MGLAAPAGRGRPGRQRLHAGCATSSRRVGWGVRGHVAQWRPQTRGLLAAEASNYGHSPPTPVSGDSEFQKVIDSTVTTMRSMTRVREAIDSTSRYDTNSAWQ